MLCLKQIYSFVYSYFNNVIIKIELIGGKDTYMSVCRTCFMSPDCSRKKLFGDVTNKNDMGMSKMHTSNAKIGGDTVNHEIVSLHTTNHNE